MQILKMYDTLKDVLEKRSVAKLFSVYAKIALLEECRLVTEFSLQNGKYICLGLWHTFSESDCSERLWENSQDMIVGSQFRLV